MAWDNDPKSDVVFIGWDHKLRWTARIARASWYYIREHHRWIIGALIAVAAVVVRAHS